MTNLILINYDKIFTSIIITNRLLEYKYVDNMKDKRTPFREKHIELANSCSHLIAAGAFTPQLDGALFIFKGKNNSELENVIKEFVQKDPYVVNKLGIVVMILLITNIIIIFPL